jgi:hypothetical protein
MFGLDLNCEEWDFDGGDCDDGTDSCGGDGYIEDCSGDGDCCPDSWVGDGYADCEDQAWGCDLTCYDNDGGDCGGRDNSETIRADVLNLVMLHNGIDNHSYAFVNKTLNSSRDFVLIGSTAGIDYTDMDVINDIEYCYYTTAVNEAGESEASNTVCATPEAGEPAADVLFGIGDLTIDLGEVGGLDLTMENEDPAAGFQFTLSATEDVAEVVNVLTTDRTEGFTVSWANNTVVGFSITGDVIEPGSGAYVVVEVVGTAGGSAEICYNDVVLADPDGFAMGYDTSCGSVTVTEDPADITTGSAGSSVTVTEPQEVSYPMAKPSGSARTTSL